MVQLERIAAGPSLDDLRTCIHCGMCLQACPTYRITGLETESPRGRIHLMEAVRTGKAPLAPEVTVHFDRCLACRACEIVCPAGVPYGRLIEDTRALQASSTAQRRPLSISGLLRSFFFGWLLPHPGRLRIVARVFSLYERAGLRALLRRSRLLRLLPRRLRMMEGVLPPLTRRPFSLARGGTLRARGDRSGRAALLTGCVMAVAYGDVHEATARLLARGGLEVVVPSDQVCCGALHAHAGEREGAVALAKQNVAAFERAEADVIVVDAAGCGAHLKHYGELLAHEPQWSARAEAIAAKTRDLSEVLVEKLRDVPLGPLALRVTYQDACHLAHAQGIREQPRALLRRIRALELVETPDADRCCGSAGIYNLVQTEYASRLLDAKMSDIRSTSAEAVVSGNPGCMLQLRFGAERDGSALRVYHLAEVLEQAARAAESR
jgi:glycolate oxidase iron-sulfur subunit